MKKSFDDLKHTRIGLPSGGEVIVLDTGAIIGPEAEAMIQALHSRSLEGFDHHLKVLANKGPEKFIKDYYVGYGHKSIGDCGTATVFVEGVSMLAAKAIQDSPLYSGQEGSTRYIDFSNQGLIDPSNTRLGREILENERLAYLEAQEPTINFLKMNHPYDGSVSKETYEKAIKARALDITRSLLPAGTSTKLAWHTNLRQAADHILFLRHHPLRELREIAGSLELALMKHFQNSFTHKRYPKTEEYQDLVAQHYFYFDEDSPSEPQVDLSKIDRKLLEEKRELFEKRPKKTELPKYLAELGVLTARFLLDFGSFRDIQRHRAISQRMPLLTTELGFNEWYLENFPPEVQSRAVSHLERMSGLIQRLGASPQDSQYFIPMGFNVSCKFTGNLPASIYMVELRDSSNVHPTLQRVAHSIGEQISRGLGIPLNIEKDEPKFDFRRGKQDIIDRSKKENEE